MSKESLGVVIQTGYENDPLMDEVNLKFREFVLDTLHSQFPKHEVHIVGERPADTAKTPEEEFLVERHRLQEIEDNADIIALLANGNPPDARTAILGGFAVGNTIPIAAMRTQHGHTGEGGLSFNLMLHAAIEKSRGYEDESWDTPLHLATTYDQFADELVDAVYYALSLNKENSRNLDKEDNGAIYPASPYGFSESTFKKFYQKDYLPLLRKFGKTKCPWKDGKYLAEIILSSDENEMARGWVGLGMKHIKSVRRSKLVVAGLDQEPPDVGTLVEVGVKASCHDPVILYRDDVRVFNLGENTKFDATVQAAATYYLPEEEALAKLDKYATNLTELKQQLEEVSAVAA